MTGVRSLSFSTYHSTVQNVLLRLALSRDLDLVLPSKGTQFSKRSGRLVGPGVRFASGHVSEAPWHEAFVKRGEYDLFALHARYTSH